MGKVSFLPPFFVGNWDRDRKRMSWAEYWNAKNIQRCVQLDLWIFSLNVLWIFIFPGEGKNEVATGDLYNTTSKRYAYNLGRHNYVLTKMQTISRQKKQLEQNTRCNSTEKNLRFIFHISCEKKSPRSLLVLSVVKALLCWFTSVNTDKTIM